MQGHCWHWSRCPHCLFPISCTRKGFLSKADWLWERSHASCRMATAVFSCCFLIWHRSCCCEVMLLPVYELILCILIWFWQSIAVPPRRLATNVSQQWQHNPPGDPAQRASGTADAGGHRFHASRENHTHLSEPSRLWFLCTSPFSYGTTRFLSVMLGCDATFEMSLSLLLFSYILISAFQSRREAIFVSLKLSSPQVFPRTQSWAMEYRDWMSVCSAAARALTSFPPPCVNLYNQSLLLWVFFLCRKAIGVSSGRNSLVAHCS